MRFVSFALSLVAAAVLAVGCSSSSTTPAGPTPTSTTTTVPGVTGVTISMPRGATFLTNTAYVPNPATVSVGGTVTWVNNDVDPHTTTSSTNVWASPTMQPGSSFSFTFQNRGTFQYVCLIHPNMVGTITVQ